MSDITLVEKHTLTMAQAREVAQQVAEQMKKDYEIGYAWEGDVLNFKRSGVSGTLALADGQATLDITLGFMLKGFRKKIEEQVGRNMHKLFSADATREA
jgi:putative polyhydroxyalkanoate system protein